MSDWKQIASEPVVESPWMTVHRNSYRLPDGSEVDVYYVVERSDFVLVVAMRHGQLVLVRQYRAARGRDYVSLPAGYLEVGESPEEAAKRELLEETGLVAGSMRLLGELHPLPGYLRSRAFVVVCETVTGELRCADPREIEEVFQLPVDEALAMIQRGEILEMQAVAAILLARAHLGE